MQWRNKISVKSVFLCQRSQCDEGSMFISKTWLNETQCYLKVTIECYEKQIRITQTSCWITGVWGSF